MCSMHGPRTLIVNFPHTRLFRTNHELITIGYTVQEIYYILSTVTALDVHPSLSNVKLRSSRISGGRVRCASDRFTLERGGGRRDGRGIVSLVVGGRGIISDHGSTASSLVNELICGTFRPLEVRLGSSRGSV